MMALELALAFNELPPLVQRLLAPETPTPMRAMAAKGIAPGLRSEHIVTVIALFAFEDISHLEIENKNTAIATFQNLPAPILSGALVSKETPASVLHELAKAYQKENAIVEKIVTHLNVSIATLELLARVSNESLTELIATNEQRLLEHVTIIEALYLNKNTRMSTAARLLDLAIRNGKTLNLPAFHEAKAAILGEPIPVSKQDQKEHDQLYREMQATATTLDQELESNSVETVLIAEDEKGEEKVQPRAIPLEQRVLKMTITEKIRAAMTEGVSVRALLVRDSNKLVAVSVVRSPRIKENEVLHFASSRAVCEDVLRAIAQNGEFLKSHALKFKLVENPKTPIAIALRLLPHLRQDELKKLSKSKNISAHIAKMSQQELAKKSPASRL